MAKASGWLAVAAVIAAFIFKWNTLYLWFVGLPLWLIFFGIPILVATVIYKKLHLSKEHPLLYAWVAAGAFLLVVWAFRAIGDAGQYHFANCWNIEPTKDRWECAPGSEPRQYLPGYSQVTDTETPGRSCDYVDTTSSGGTIWQCRDE